MTLCWHKSIEYGEIKRVAQFVFLDMKKIGLEVPERHVTVFANLTAVILLQAIPTLFIDLFKASIPLLPILHDSVPKAALQP